MNKVFVFVLGGAAILCLWSLLMGIAMGDLGTTEIAIISSIGVGASGGVWYNLVRCIKFPS